MMDLLVPDLLPLLLGTGIFLALMAGIFIPLEGWFPHRRRAMTRRAACVCVALLLANVVVMEVVGGSLLDALAADVRGFVTPPGPARAAAVFVLAELFGYWIHRVMHRVPWLWRFHAVHHAPAHVNWLEAWRQHPVDFVLHGIVVGLPAAVLGASFTELGAVVLLRKTFTTYLHANVSWRLTWLEPFVATPAFHRLHHSQRPRDYDCNFAGMFPILDTIFGTRGDSSRAW